MWEKIKGNRLYLLLFLTILVFLFLKYLVPLVSPLLVAMLFVTIFGPLLQKLQVKFHLHRQFGVILLLLLAAAVLVAIGGILINWIIGSMPEWLEIMAGFQNSWTERLSGFLSQGALSKSANYIKGMGAFGGFFVTFFIGTVLLAKDYDRIMNELLERPDCHILLQVICGVIRYIAIFVKAQFFIMLTIALVAAVILTFTGIPKGALWGILAGVLDALPFVGTGIVLLPLGIWQVLQGKMVRAAVCAILYGICVFLREMLEPKLIGNRMGVPPIAVLLSLYVGIELFGVSGILKGPLGYVIIRESYHSILRLEKLPE